MNSKLIERPDSYLGLVQRILAASLAGNKVH